MREYLLFDWYLLTNVTQIGHTHVGLPWWGSSVFRLVLALLGMLTMGSVGWSQVLDKSAKLAEQTFWDNRDFDWYAASIPFFECPDADLTTTYYYRWELLTKTSYLWLSQ